MIKNNSTKTPGNMCTIGWCEITLLAELQFAAVRGSKIIFKEYAFIKDKFVYNQNLKVGGPVGRCTFLKAHTE